MNPRSEDLRPRGNRDNEGRKLIMSEQDAFDRILASLHEAMLDDVHWLPTFALIDDTCRTKGSFLTFAEGSTEDDIEIYYKTQVGTFRVCPAPIWSASSDGRTRYSVDWEAMPLYLRLTP